MGKYPLTMDEAAAEFRMSRRSFQKLIKEHPHYVLLGGKKLFYAQDMQALRRVGRREAFIHAPPKDGQRPPNSAELETRRELAKLLWPIKERKNHEPPKTEPKEKRKRFYTSKERERLAGQVVAFRPRPPKE